MTTYIEPPKSEDCQWQTQSPVEPGWYPASVNFPPNPNVLRYYFGDGQWSKGYGPDADASYFELFGEPTVDETATGVMWCAPWWIKGMQPVVDIAVVSDSVEVPQ